MNKQQQAIALLINLLCARPQRRKELLRNQFSFVAVIRDEEVVAAHGEFFMGGDVPFHEVTKTHTGVAFRNLITGGMAFVPFAVEDVATAPVADPATAAAPAAAVVVTRTMRVSFGEKVEFWNSTFSGKVEFTAPSSGAVIEEVHSDGGIKITFVGTTRQTWTI